MVRHGGRNIAPSGFIASVDAGRCTGCGNCGSRCPFKAMGLEGTAVVAWEKCMGCGVCEALCPAGAITLERDERKGLPLDVRAMK